MNGSLPHRALEPPLRVALQRPAEGRDEAEEAEEVGQHAGGDEHGRGDENHHAVDDRLGRQSAGIEPPTCPPVPQGPTLGTLIDAYLQDYQVRQFRSLGTARGRVAQSFCCEVLVHRKPDATVLDSNIEDIVANIERCGFGIVKLGAMVDLVVQCDNVRIVHLLNSAARSFTRLELG